MTFVQRGCLTAREMWYFPSSRAAGSAARLNLRSDFLRRRTKKRIDRRQLARVTKIASRPSCGRTIAVTAIETPRFSKIVSTPGPSRTTAAAGISPLPQRL